MADAGPLAAPPHDPGAVRQVADELLAEQRYARGLGLQEQDPGGALAAVWDRIVGLLRAMVDLQESAPVLYWLLVGGLVLLAAALIAHIVYTVRRGAAAGRAGVPRPVEELVRETDVELLRRMVARAEEDGDLAGALRARFALVLASVLGPARLRTLGHLTYRELVRTARRHGAGPGLDEAMLAIEESTYAGMPLDEARYRRCVRDLEQGEGR